MASILVYIFYTYLSTGFIFAVWFTIHGVNKVDAGIHGAPWGVWVLIFPGSALLWPVLLSKYLKAK